ncbi:reverse transcriptase domain-containing protein [Chloroflexus sp.]|uniref:reverse transcriptase domain-containing protein n=1 Tax=Chloroflexus sp. TaxID=1904827 RepID=UPI00262A1558|nr:reverse transcriptase domain-containing protein [uncultured Chloroflexus sp.]
MPLFPRYYGPPLIEQVCSVENLTNAWRRVRSNIQMSRRDRSAGIDRVTLRDFEADWPAQMTQLAEELRDGSYRPLPPRRVLMPKAHGGERAIAILTIRDRIAQRAVQQTLTPLFEPLFLDCSYGCRLAVGVPEAVERVARYAEQGLSWVVDSDISSYFDSIDHSILLSLVRQRIDEPAILRLIGQWLSVGALGQEAESVTQPPDSPLATALRRGGELIDNIFSPPAEPPLPDPSMAHPYDIALNPPRAPLSTGFITALSLAQPALDMARRLGPLARRIGPQRLLLGGALAAGAVVVSELVHYARSQSTRRGAPQGSPLSPLLANIYLHPFDVAMTTHGARLVRFVDDFVVMCPDRAAAERTLTLVERQLATLRLQLNPTKTRIVAYADGVEFLGQTLAPRRGQSFFHGLTNFHEAEQRLREQMNRLRRPKKPAQTE